MFPTKELPIMEAFLEWNYRRQKMKKDWEGKTAGQINRELASRDEQIWTEYAKAALTGCLAYSHVNPMTGNYHENSTPERVAWSVSAHADVMLEVHKERWGHE